MVRRFLAWRVLLIGCMTVTLGVQAVVQASPLRAAHTALVSQQASTPAHTGSAVKDEGIVQNVSGRNLPLDPNTPAHLEQVEASAHPVTVFVRLADPALALYHGGLAPYAATAPARGSRIDTTSSTAHSYAAYLSSKQDALQAAIQRVAPAAHEIARYHLLINAMVLTVPGNTLRAIRRLSGVTGLWLSKEYVPTLNESVKLIDVPALWNSTLISGTANAGTGMKIADIDTGIDQTNPMFNPAGYTYPSGFPSCDIQSNCAYTTPKVIVAKAYPRGAGLSAQDSLGHGTATASVEAGELTTADPEGLPLQGVAPAAYLMNYNVFPAGAISSTDTVIVQAVEDAVSDGADVINMSLGGAASDLGLDPLEQAVSAAVAAGVPVAISAGNDGAVGPETVSSPGQDPDAITSGASSNTHQAVSGPTVALTTSTSFTATVPITLTNIGSQTSSLGPITQTVVGPLALAPPDPTNADAPDGCSVLPDGSMTGAIALIERGTCAFTTKIQNAQAAGAIGVVIWDNKDEPPIEMSVPDTTIPSVMISNADGQNLVAYATAISPTIPDLSISLPIQDFLYALTPNVLESFSSTGPGPNNEIKPDVTAPGFGIVSAGESEFPGGDEYDPSGFVPNFSGTSAASPHTAGVLALLRQIYPTWTPEQLKDAVMNTSNPDIYLDSGHTITASVQQQGAGLVDAYAAATTPLLIQPGSLSLGQVNESGGAPITMTGVLTITNVSTQTQTFTMGISPTNLAPGVSVGLPSGTTTVPVSGTAVVSSTITVSGASPGDYGAYMTVTTGDGVTLHVPVFFVVTNVTVTPGSVLLVDDFSAEFDGQAGDPFGLGVANYSDYYTQTLTDLGVPYTLWDESVLGNPSLTDLQQAAAVVYYTGANQGPHGSQGSPPAVTALDQTTLDQYVASGGRLFITGSGVGSAPGDNAVEGIGSSLFVEHVLHNGIVQTSIYDGPGSVPLGNGFGASPPSPSMAGVAGDPIGTGLNLDINVLSGDGAGVCCIDNVAITDSVDEAGDIPVGGVTELAPLSGTTTYSDSNLMVTGNATAVFTVPATVSGTSTGVIASKDSFEPTLEQPAGYNGRTVYFGFGFEGINNPGTTGVAEPDNLASRDEVMQRVLSWLTKSTTAQASVPSGVAGTPITATASLSGTDILSGTVPTVAGTRWDFGDNSGSTTVAGDTILHTYDVPGTYTVTVQITDALGHSSIATTTTTISEPAETETPSATTTPTVLPSSSETATASETPTTSPTGIVTTTETAMPTGTSTPSPATPTETVISTPTPMTTVPTTSTATTAGTSTATAQPVSPPVVVPAPTVTPTPTATSTATSVPTSTPTATETQAPSATPTTTTSSVPPFAPTNTSIPGAPPTTAPVATATLAAAPTPVETETETPTPTVAVHNAPRTVKGGRAIACDLLSNLKKLGAGCEIISSVSVPDALVTMTITYPGHSVKPQTFKGTTDSRGHVLHIFNVPYVPPVGAKFGTTATIATVNVVVILADGTALPPARTRFSIVR